MTNLANLYCANNSSRPLRERCVFPRSERRLFDYVAGLWVLAALLLGGCGPSGPKLVPVSGKVTIDGKPLTIGSIQFVPENARPAYGEIGSDGSFKLKTDEEEGVVLGQHKVVVTAQEIAGTEATGESVRYIAPQRYGSPLTTDVTVNIEGPRDDLLIELTSKP